MNLQSPIEPTAKAFCSAVICNLLPYAYRAFTPAMKNEEKRPEDAPLKERRPFEHECEMFMFPQMWGSTALGFGGIGGSAMTSAYTMVVIGPNRDACVYFNGGLAYHILKPNRKFFEDLHAHQMNARAGASSRYEERCEGADKDAAKPKEL